MAFLNDRLCWETGSCAKILATEILNAKLKQSGLVALFKAKKGRTRGILS